MTVTPAPAAAADNTLTQDFYTDKQLRARWHCSQMKLVRLRARGKLRGTFKVGDTGMNLTPGSEVRALEVPSQNTQLDALRADGEEIA